MKYIAKIIKNIFKSIGYLFLAVLRLLVFAYILLNINPFQKYLADYFAGILSEKLGTTISIGYVNIELFDKIVLNDLYISDQNQDTLAYIEKFKFTLGEISFSEKEAHLDRMLIDHSYFNLSADSSGRFNFQYIIDYLSKDTIPDTTSSDWKIFCSEIRITESRVNYIKNISDSTNYDKIDFNNIQLSGFNLRINDVQFLKDSMLCHIQNLGFIDKSGFRVKNFSAVCQLDSASIGLNDMKILTNKSLIAAPSFDLLFNDMKTDFADFINNVKIEAVFDSSIICLGDLQYFAPALKGLNRKVLLSGNVTGRISRLKGKNIFLEYGKNTRFIGGFSMDGLPDFDNTFIYADIDEFTTSISDIESFPVPPFEENNKLSLPSQLSQLGKITYKGKLTGFANDFVTYGNFNTAIGYVSTDLSLKQDSLMKKMIFSGKLNTINFNIGKLIQKSEDIGKLSFNANINGSYSTITENIEAILDGNIISVDLLDYTYSDITVNGTLFNKKFDGQLIINDPNLKMDFLGRFDFNEKVPVFDFTADIGNINPYELKIDTIDSLLSAGFLVTAKFTGDNPDEIQGTLDLFDIRFTNSNSTINMKSLNIRSELTGDQRSFRLNSDFVNAFITGNFTISSLENSLKKIIDKYIPAFNYLVKNNKDETPGKSVDKNASAGSANCLINLNIDVINSNEILKLFAPDLELSGAFKVISSYNSINESLVLKSDISYLKIKDILLSDINLDLQTIDSTVQTLINISRFDLNKNINLRNIAIKNRITKNEGTLSVEWNNLDSVEYSGELLSNFVFIEKEDTLPAIEFIFDPSLIVLNNQQWFLNDCRVVIDTTSIMVDNMTFNHDQQYFYANGTISSYKYDTLHILFNEIMLNNFNQLLVKQKLTLGGVLNGEASLSNLFNNATAISSIKIDNLELNDDPLGNLSASTTWVNKEKKIFLSAYTERGNLKTIHLDGDYFIESSDIDFKLHLDKFHVNMLEPFLGGVISTVRGMANGDVSIKGKINNPLIEGVVSLQKMSFTIDYLKTRYNFTDNVSLTNDKISFDSIMIFDTYGNHSVANGKINHKNFRDFTFDITLDADKFLFMDTKAADNELFYGEAFASGMVKLTGNPENVKIKVDAKTEKIYDPIIRNTLLTKIMIPLTGSEDLSENDFIRFVNKNITDTIPVESYKADLSGIELDFDLEVTPDAEVQIIFDSKVGDIIRARGNSNLKLEINTLGIFNMFGEFIIEEGDYLFTLQNVINKKFSVEKGGYIKWNGDPYDGYMDVSAIYKLKTSLYDLTLDTSQTKRVPVECRLNLTKNILAPDIKFSISIPEGGDEAANLVSRMTDDEINKQILSLLVLNRFYTPPALTGSNPVAEQRTSAVGVTSSELLSNQLSHWLSQISNDVDIGVNYRPGDELTSEELEVALSTQILNDRVTINGNVGMANQANNASNFIGDVMVDFKINKSGKLRLKGYNKTNNNLIYQESPYTQGIGLFYREDFDHWGQLMRKYWVGKE